MTVSKFNPNKNSNATTTHRFQKYYAKDGTYFPAGNGCKLGGKSCLECKLPDCQWDESRMSRKGE